MPSKMNVFISNILSKTNVFIICSISFIFGIFLGSIQSFDKIVLIILIFIFLSLLIIFWSEYAIKVSILIILFIFLGIGRYGLAEPKINSQTLQFYNGQKVKFVGIISDEPDVRKDKTNLVVNVNKLKLNGIWQKITGRVLVNVSLYPEYSYGDELEVEGNLETPPEFEDFSYRDYLSRYQIYSSMRDAYINRLAQGKGNPIRFFLINLKIKFAEKIDQTLPEPQASLLAGILYGAKRGIPSNIMENFNKTGLTHIVVISGYNITIIASLLLLLFGWLPRRWSFIAALLGILLFTIFVGAGASVIRAAIMGSIGLLAFQVGRKNNIFAALLLAAIIMLLWNPLILRFDIGFQLSFLATAGLIFLAPFFETIFKRLPKILAESASLTLAAQFFAAPIILYNFHRLSLVAPLANILVLPTIPIVMIFGFVGTFFGFLFIPLGQLINWSSWALLTYIIKITQFLARLPLSSLDFKTRFIWLIGYYGLLFAFLIWQSSLKSKHKAQSSNIK
jgi:competence protein ComEC